jgi:glycosyltransferase involved in cell wall biosynthesis
MRSGVSVIICTYNGESRLPETLEHLAGQMIPPDLNWEVLLIDNASTDNSWSVALQLQQKFPHLPLKLIQEPVPGKINALNRGFKESLFNYCITCDDDCWLNSYYIHRAFQIMESEIQIGVVNGPYENLYDGEPPEWLKNYEKAFSVTYLGEARLDITGSLGSIWGAGMVLRKKAYQLLLNSGFKPILTGGLGAKRSAGEDTELCLAIRLLGYQIIYDPSLNFRHFMPVRRMKWRTLIEIARANGAASIFYSPYRYHYARQKGEVYKVHTHWKAELLTNLKFLLNLRSWVSYFFNRKPGNPAVIRIERQMAKVKALFKVRGLYDESFRRIGTIADASIGILKDSKSQ